MMAQMSGGGACMANNMVNAGGVMAQQRYTVGQVMEDFATTISRLCEDGAVSGTTPIDVLTTLWVSYKTSPTTGLTNATQAVLTRLDSLATILLQDTVNIWAAPCLCTTVSGQLTVAADRTKATAMGVNVCNGGSGSVGSASGSASIQTPLSTPSGGQKSTPVAPLPPPPKIPKPIAKIPFVKPLPPPNDPFKAKGGKFSKK